MTPNLPPGGVLLDFPKKSGWQCPKCLDQPEQAKNGPPGVPNMPICFGLVTKGDNGEPRMRYLCVICYGQFLVDNLPELIPYTGLNKTE